MEENKVNYKKVFMCSFLLSIGLSACICFVLFTTHSVTVPEFKTKCDDRSR